MLFIGPFGALDDVEGHAASSDPSDSDTPVNVNNDTAFIIRCVGVFRTDRD